ncbi:MAG: hypothetical protein LBK08_02030 [Treponema sp.]|jgi:hypothetical protein|nr:hypothetical protein [Treponema sp.]
MNKKEETKMNKISEKLYDAIYDKLKNKPKKMKAYLKKELQNYFKNRQNLELDFYYTIIKCFDILEKNKEAM